MSKRISIIAWLLSINEEKTKAVFSFDQQYNDRDKLLNATQAHKFKNISKDSFTVFMKPSDLASLEQLGYGYRLRIEIEISTYSFKSNGETISGYKFKLLGGSKFDR